MKILLPVDGSEHTKRMLNYIVAHPDLLGPDHDFAVLHVVPALPSGVSRYLEPSMTSDHYEACAKEVLEPIQTFIDQRVWKKVQFLSRQGDAASVIAEFAEAVNIDLIVMGTHGRSAFGNVLLGSVTSGVLARCKVPVLLVR